MNACLRCRHHMNPVSLDRWYGFRAGAALTAVFGYVCPACGYLAFTPRQIDEMEARAERLHE